jgi:cell division protease FtsH
MSRGELRGEIVGALGGRAAEELVFGELSTGAEKDIEKATLLARMMVERWGMSEALGPVTVLDGDPAVPGASPVADDTRRLVDEEVRAIAESSYDEAVTLLREHRERLERLATALLERETLDQAEVYRIAALDGAPAGSSVERPARA